MVSKAAVIALVAIVAVPILLGYGMNLQTSTHTDYNEAKDPVNVTGLLLNGEYYNTAFAEIYQINTSVTTNGANRYPVMPIYQQQINTYTSLPFSLYQLSNWPGGGWNLAPFVKLYMLFDYHYPGGLSNYATMSIRDSSHNELESIARISYLYYDRTINTINYSYYNTSGDTLEGTYTNSNIGRLYFTLTGLSSLNGYWGGQTEPLGNDYVDLSAGFKLNKGQSTIELPNYTSSYLLTFNLDSDNASIFRFRNVVSFNIHKTTIDGVTQYYVTDSEGNNTFLYYEPNRTDNTYQYYYSVTNTGYDESDGRYHFLEHHELRYVGSWPTYIGEAPYYFKYEFENTGSVISTFTGLNYIDIEFVGVDYSPIIRFDSAKFTGLLFNTINDNTYNPADFRDNPTTKISDISLFGSSLTFGGNVYDVKDGNITLGTREFSVRDMEFSSIPITGGYSNRINNIEVSTSATPSTITFTGHWSAQVTTDSMVESTYTSTDWTVGQFAWDGIDTNFLIVGLITSTGMFIALGIHMARTKAKFWPVLIVCGGAAILFFTML